MSKPSPILLIICAASGTGKSSLTRALVESEPGAILSVSHTTRQIGHNEVDGKDYFFVSDQVFRKMIESGHFVEYANVYAHYYGTSRKVIASNLNAGLSVVLDIDWQGARQVADQFDCAVRVFLLPPSVEVLQQRLVNRQRDSHDVIQSRLQMAIEDMRHCSEFDHIVLNDNFDAALHDLRSLLHGNHGAVRALPATLFDRLHLTA